MKLALLLATSLASTAFAGTVNSPYEVGTWQGFRTAAVSYTFDDNLGNQYSIAVPMFNAKGFKLTLFTVTGWAGDWSASKTAASYGHEIASHSVTHSDFNSSSTDQTAECRDSQSAINSNISNQKCVTIAYPYCSVGNEAITAQYYIAARGCWGVERSTPNNFMSIASVICGSEGTSDLNGVADSAASSGGWCVFLIHALDSEGGYSPLPSSVLQSSVNYMDSNRSKFWVETFANVARYIRERNDVSVAETGSTSTSLTVSVTHSLDNSIFNFPITIRRPLPSGWSSASASQAGKDLGAQIVMVNGTRYIMFDAVPNGGTVTITSGSTSASGGTYKLLARHSAKALEAAGNSTSNGTQIQQWTYIGGANQKWSVNSLGNGQYSIIGVRSGKCIDINNAGTSNGTKVHLWDYFGGAHQRFTFTATSSGYYRITPTHATGSCLDVSGPSTSDGAVVHLWQWLNANNQQWLLQPVDGTVKLVARHSGKAMDAYGAQTANGTQIIQWSYGGGNNQKWALTDTGSGNYRILGVQSGKSLDVNNAGTGNGTKVQLWDYFGGAHQLFKFTGTDPGYFRITPTHATASGLSIESGSTADGAKVWLWQYNANPPQQWAPQTP